MFTERIARLVALAEHLPDSRVAGVSEKCLQRGRLGREVQDAAGIVITAASLGPPRCSIVDSRRLDRSGEVGVDLVHLRDGEDALEEQEAGLGQKMGGLCSPLAEPEPLVELKPRSVERLE